MSARKPQQEIVSLPVAALYSHPGNPNRMSKSKFARLVADLGRTGQYEPLVVRRRAQGAARWQVLNGHHRLRALKQLGYRRVDCVVFGADDAQAQLYLLNLNRLCGRDNLYKKAQLIERLCEHFTSRELARRIGDSKTAIEKLTALSRNQPLPRETAGRPFRIPMTFFMDEAQHALVASAFAKAMAAAEGPHSRQRIGALVRIAEAYLETDAAEPPRDVSAME